MFLKFLCTFLFLVIIFPTLHPDNVLLILILNALMTVHIKRMNCTGGCKGEITLLLFKEGFLLGSHQPVQVKQSVSLDYENLQACFHTRCICRVSLFLRALYLFVISVLGLLMGCWGRWMWHEPFLFHLSYLCKWKCRPSRHFSAELWRHGKSLSWVYPARLACHRYWVDVLFDCPCAFVTL